MREPHEAIAGALNAALAPRIKTHAPRVIAAIDLDDELDGWSTEVDDLLADDDLAAKADAELATLEVTPK